MQIELYACWFCLSFIHSTYTHNNNILIMPLTFFLSQINRFLVVYKFYSWRNSYDDEAHVESQFDFLSARVVSFKNLNSIKFKSWLKIFFYKLNFNPWILLLMLVCLFSRMILMCRWEHETIFIFFRSRADTEIKNKESTAECLFYANLCERKTNSFPTDHATFGIMDYDNLFLVHWSVSLTLYSYVRVLTHEKWRRK